MQNPIAPVFDIPAEFACLEIFPVDAHATRCIDALAGVKGRLSQVVVGRADEATTAAHVVITGFVEPPNAGVDAGNLRRPESLSRSCW